MNAFVADFVRKVRVSPRLQVTQHAFLRARERFHWRPETLLRMADRALRAGYAPGDAAGSLRYFLESKVSTKTASCPFLYGQNVYVYCREAHSADVTLLTVYRAPNELLRALIPKPRRGFANVFLGRN
jgi:hypothetical protein